MTKPNDDTDMEALFDELAVAVLLIGNEDGIVRRVNSAVCRDMKKRCDEIQDHHYRQVFWPVRTTSSKI